MQASTVLLTNKSDASTLNVLGMATVKIKPSDSDVLVLLDSDDYVCFIIDLLIHHIFFIKLRLPIQFWSLWILIKPLRVYDT